MLIKKATLLLSLMAGFGFSQAPCSPKIFNEQGRNSCEFLIGKSDTDRIILAIMLTRPYPAVENIPENIANMRKWNDSLFNKYDLRLHYLQTEKSPSPADSSKGWEIGLLTIPKVSIQALVLEDFVARLEYRSKWIEVSLIRFNVERRSNPIKGRMFFYDVAGKRIESNMSSVDGANLNPEVLIMREK